MKRKAFKTFLMALVAVIASDFSALAASPFASLTKRSDLSYTFVSKELVKTKLHNLYRGAIYTATLVPEIESICIFEATTPTGIEACRKAVKEFQENAKNCKMVMTSKDLDEISYVLGIPMDNNDDSRSAKYKSIIIYQEDKGEVNIVVVNDEPPAMD